MTDEDDDESFGGGDTKAHYLPVEPRAPAPSAPPCRARGCRAPLNHYGTCSIHFRESLHLNEATPVHLPSAPSEAYAVMEVDLPTDDTQVVNLPRSQSPTDVDAPTVEPPRARPKRRRVAEGESIALKKMPRSPDEVFRDPPQIPARTAEPAAPISDPPRSRSIAELFQDMLRAAYQAGVTAAASGETFETWYQREVLR